MKITSNIPEAAASWFGDMSKLLPTIVQRAAHTAGIRGEAMAKKLIAAEAYDTGAGLRSVTHEVQVTKTEVVLRVYAAAEHMLFVEEGRKPGSFPNLDALTKWVGRKLREEGVNTRVNISFDQLKALAKTKGARGTATAEAKAARQHLSALYLIGRAIATRGIKAKLIFRRIEKAVQDIYRQEIENQIQSL